MFGRMHLVWRTTIGGVLVGVPEPKKLNIFVLRFAKDNCESNMTTSRD
jgi:hypothetical protein